MPPINLPSDEADRLTLFKALAALDIGRDPVFDRFASLARDLCGGDDAAVTLINPALSWVKRLGSSGRVPGPGASALCAQAALQTEATWVEDARLDPRFAHDDGVRSGLVAAYAAAPLKGAPGLATGLLSVAWRSPRPRDPAAAAKLAALAELVADALSQRRERTEVETEVSRAIVRLAPASVAVLDRAFGFLMASERLEAEWGLPERELFNRCVFDVFPSTRDIEPLIRRAQAGEAFSDHRAAFTRNDGSSAVYDWDLAPWRNQDGDIGGVRIMTFDVTELVRSQELAARTEERLKLALDVADTVVWEMDFRTGQVSSEGRFDRFFEERAEHADLLQELSRFVHPDDRERVDAEWWATVGKGLPLELEYRLARASGEDFWVMSNARAFTDARGQPARVIGVLRDITERKQRDFALEAAREAAEAANRAKSEFLANMSHEIRTPLNGVLGVAGALSRTDLGESQQEMVRLIETSAQNLGRMLGDVLDLARIESGRLALRYEPFSIGELVVSLAAIFAKEAQAKGVTFRFDQRARFTGQYMGDPVRLRQILCNLLSNAVKFTLKGQVTLRVEALPAEEEGRQPLRLSVIDTGVGFDAAAGERLFRRFEQADGSITRRFGGTGLGLPISRSLAEAMGGTLEAHSTPGKGSRFTLMLELEPAAEALPAEPAPEPPAEADAPPSRLRVLLAEDHPINRKVAELILSSAHVDLTVVEDGEQAVAAFFDDGRFDLVLMDMQMPVMDGLTAIRTIRAREAAMGAERTAIHVLTANAMPEHVAASLASGADGHLTKPIAAAALLGLVAEVRAATPSPAKRRRSA